MFLQNYNSNSIFKVRWFYMSKPFSIFLIALFCQLVFFNPSFVTADSFKLSSISIVGNKRISDAAITNFSKLMPETVMNSEDLNIAYSNLLDTGLFGNIKFSRKKDSLIITVEEYPTVNRISFEGNKRLADKRLSAVIKSKPRFVLSPKILEKDIVKIQSLYRDSGRLSTSINAKVVNLSDNRVDLIFEIYEGSVVEIEKINFSGNRNFSDRRLKRVLSSKQAGLFRKVITRDNLIAERIKLDKKLLLDFYRNRGFKDFKINDVNIELSEAKDSFFITYNITEGPKFTIGEVVLNLDEAEINPSDFINFVDIKMGDTYSPEIIDTTILKLEKLLQSKGLEFIQVRPKLNRNIKSLTLDLELIFFKGNRVFVERIDISGNTATQDKVVRRQFNIIEGDPLNLREIKASENRIRALGLFSDTSVKILPGSNNSQIVIDVEVREKPTGTLSFGAGYSSAAGLAAMVEYGEKNFLGRGQNLSFSVKTGKDDKLYALSFYEPMFLRNDLGLGINFSLKDTKRQNAAYDTEDLRFRPYLAFPLGEKSKLKINYTISQTNLSNPGNVGAIITSEVNEGKVNTSSIGYGLIYDTKLYDSDEKTAFVIRLDQQFAGLGGDKTALKTTLGTSAERSAFKGNLTLTANFEAGILNYTKGNSRVVDRFFLGSNKMRGFAAGGLGPRECPSQVCGSTNNDALGGENFAVLRFEAEFPIGLPDEYGMSGGLFYDIGNLWSLKETQIAGDDVLYEDGSWRQVVGASLFWTTPLGPLRFNFSEVLKKELYDKEESFELTISTRF